MSKRLSLEDVEWREFRIKDIFETFHGSNGLQTPTGSYIPKNELYISSIPRITVRDTNNGIDSYCSSNNKNYRCFENFISVSFMGSAFYHPYKASLDMKVHALIPKNFHLTKNISLFLIRSLKNNTKFYSYGNQLSSTDLPRQKMLLPVDNKNEPNWQFMEDYIKQEQKIIAHKVIDYYEQKMLETAFDLVGLEDVEWKNFKLGSLFTFERKPSKGLNHLDTDKNRGISYLGATNKNNGVLEFVDPISNLVYRGNCIAFIRNGEGSMGYSVYKKENFMATQDISVGYNENLNQYNGMFITTVADRVRGKYNFGYKRNQSRLENEILTLPADKNGNPHWEYMSKFMQKLEVEKISNFLPYIYIYIYIYIYRLAMQYKEKMIPLEQKTWSEFWLEELFYIENGKCSNVSSLKKGNIPYVGATNRNNGILSFVDAPAEMITSGNSIAFICDGEGSIGLSVYRESSYVASTTIKVGFSSNLNEHVGKFITTVADRVRPLYTFGYKRNTKRLKNEKLLLPIDSEGKPDYDYMKKYIPIQEIKEIYKALQYLHTSY